MTKNSSLAHFFVPTQRPFSQAHRARENEEVPPCRVEPIRQHDEQPLVLRESFQTVPGSSGRTVRGLHGPGFGALGWRNRNGPRGRSLASVFPRVVTTVRFRPSRSSSNSGSAEIVAPRVGSRDRKCRRRQSACRLPACRSGMPGPRQQSEDDCHVEAGSFHHHQDRKEGRLNQQTTGEIVNRLTRRADSLPDRLRAIRVDFQCRQPVDCSS